MTLKIHMSSHNDDLHNTTAKRNIAGGIVGLNINSKFPIKYIPLILNTYLLSNNVLHNNPCTSLDISFPSISISRLAWCKLVTYLVLRFRAT